MLFEALWHNYGSYLITCIANLSNRLPSAKPDI